MFGYECNYKPFESELFELARQFYTQSGGRGFSAVQTVAFDGGGASDTITADGAEYVFSYSDAVPDDKTAARKILLRQRKISLYKALQDRLGVSLPWGALTGVRPVRLGYGLLSEGVPPGEIAAAMSEKYLVSADKARLVSRVIAAQSGCVRRGDGKTVDFYVHIPLCPTRCNYCSFVAVPIGRLQKYVEPYADALVREIAATAKTLADGGFSVASVYVGGGTPAALPPELLRRVLEAVPYKDVEFTCEAGRPDAVTDEKLKIMRGAGVNRVCVNPQTLNDATLRAIGRGHTAADFFAAYEKAYKLGFTVNTDLIAGLEGEDLAAFTRTLTAVRALNPHNITVHTLCNKRGSDIAANGQAFPDPNASDAAGAMVAFADGYLSDAKYVPYYLYRQKLAAGNLENVGYTLDGFRCVFNINAMEENLPVAACGAGGVSKKIIPSAHGVKIERFANVKDIKLYLEEFNKRLPLKQIFLSI
ncbi:MAG: coproporphyrinogen dehydrogenase HemZ [Clostridiales bacterium]|jgi:oxygen-independent coproporphyrinogen-3 oxidase|nr:coproporphyrinogen dehydrogenase HemZ [Clostridiales bacterium]